MDAPETALRGQDTTAGGRLYMAFELGEKNWKLSLGDGQRAALLRQPPGICIFPSRGRPGKLAI